MRTYLLDFTNSPLKPEAGGQLHKVVVSSCHDFDAAAARLAEKYGLVGQTDTYVPALDVQVYPMQEVVANIQRQEVPRFHAPRLPRPVEVLAVLPYAFDFAAQRANVLTFRLTLLTLVQIEYQPHVVPNCYDITVYDEDGEALVASQSPNWHNALCDNIDAALRRLRTLELNCGRQAASLYAQMCTPDRDKPTPQGAAGEQ